MESQTMNRAWPNEFHVSRAVRERCGFGETLFASSGVAVLAHPAAAQRFAAALDAGMGRARRSSAAELFAMGLLDEAAHLLIAHWRSRHDPNGLRDALADLERTLGRPAIDGLLLAFIEAFPPRAVHRGEQRAAAWLAGAEPAPGAGATGRAVARTHREVALEELLLRSLPRAVRRYPARTSDRVRAGDARARGVPRDAAEARDHRAHARGVPARPGARGARVAVRPARVRAPGVGARARRPHRAHAAGVRPPPRRGTLVRRPCRRRRGWPRSLDSGLHRRAGRGRAHQ